MGVPVRYLLALSILTGMMLRQEATPSNHRGVPQPMHNNLHPGGSPTTPGSWYYHYSSTSTPERSASRVDDVRLQGWVSTQQPHDLTASTATTTTIDHPLTTSDSATDAATSAGITSELIQQSVHQQTSTTISQVLEATSNIPSDDTEIHLTHKTHPSDPNTITPSVEYRKVQGRTKPIVPIEQATIQGPLTTSANIDRVGLIHSLTAVPEGGDNEGNGGDSESTTPCPNEIIKATEAKLLAADLLSEQLERLTEESDVSSVASPRLPPTFISGEGSGGTSTSHEVGAETALPIVPQSEPVIKWRSSSAEQGSADGESSSPGDQELTFLTSVTAQVTRLTSDNSRAPSASEPNVDDVGDASVTTTSTGVRIGVTAGIESATTTYSGVTSNAPTPSDNLKSSATTNAAELPQYIYATNAAELPQYIDASGHYLDPLDGSAQTQEVFPRLDDQNALELPNGLDAPLTSMAPLQPTTAAPRLEANTRWFGERGDGVARIFGGIKKVVERKRSSRRLNDVMGDMPYDVQQGRLTTEPTTSPMTSPVTSTTINVTKVPDVIADSHDATSENITHLETPLQPGTRPPPVVEKKTLHLGGLFELSGVHGNGRSELDAARMAVDHINQQDIVSGYTLKLVHNDTKCDPGYGADAFYDLVYRKPTMMMLIGSSCSEVTKTLAEIVPYWNLVQISYAATSPALSKREKYPNFYRLAAADSSHNAARKTFIQRFGWDTVAILHEDLETFSLAVNDMHATFNKVNITVKATLTFRGLGADLHVKMLDLNRTDARIIIGSFQEDAARQVFCEAYHLGMYGPRYVWMLVGWYTERWWTQGKGTSCSPRQLAMVVEGYFSVDTLNSIIGNRTSRSGLTTQQFLAEYDHRNLTRPRSSYAQVTYDTVWTVALTLRHTMQQWRLRPGGLTLDSFTYRTGAPMFRDFFRVLGNLEFMGVSGPISFDGPDRRGISVLEQNQGGLMKRIAIFYPENNTLDLKCLGCKPTMWTGGKIPADKYTIVTRREHIEPGAFFTVCASGSVGILVASFFLGFNLYHRKLKYIKLSSPKLNNVAVIGCIHVYLAVILLGFDDATLDVTYFPVMCTVRAFLMAAGFSLAFGAMFTKTYRVHQIFTRAHSGLVKSKLLKDTQLLFIVVALLIVDVFIIGLWVSIDPMHRSVTNFTSVPSEEDIDLLYIPQLAKCDSSHLDKWLGAFYAYKGLLLLFGVYMAWETRHVKIPVLNDSQYIGMNIYNVVLMSVTVVALSSILTDRPTLSYAVVSALIILSTTGLLGLLFLPKIYAIVKHNGSPIITSAGLTVEANTRRFAVDEKKELYYRAEVQNRVYKRELVELDQELLRLERLLELPGPQYNHVGEDLLYLLPDTRPAHSTPSRMRRRKADLVRCDSSTFITDAADVCSDLPEINLSCLDDEKRKLEKKDSGFHTMSFKNSNFMTAEEENPRTSRSLTGEERLSGVGGSGAEHSASSPESEPFLGARPPGPDIHVPSDGGALYSQLRRQSSNDGDLDERQSLLVSEAGEEDILGADAHVRSATILVNKSGLRSHSDHALGRSNARQQLHEHYELRDMSRSTATLSQPQRQHTNPLPPSGKDIPWPSSSAIEKQSKPFKVRRAKMTETLVKSPDVPFGPSQASGGATVKPAASTSQQQQQQRTLTEAERRRKIQVLQRELARIQKELKSLGELEIEVSYV